MVEVALTVLVDAIVVVPTVEVAVTSFKICRTAIVLPLAGLFHICTNASFPGMVISVVEVDSCSPPWNMKENLAGRSLSEKGLVGRSSVGAEAGFENKKYHTITPNAKMAIRANMIFNRRCSI